MDRQAGVHRSRSLIAAALAFSGVSLAACGTPLESAIPSAASKPALAAAPSRNAYPNLGDTPQAAAKPMTSAEEQKILGSLQSAKASQRPGAPAPGGGSSADTLKKKAQENVDDTLRAIGSQ